MSDGLVTKILLLSLKQGITGERVMNDYLVVNDSIHAYNQRRGRPHNPKENYILKCLNKGYTRLQKND